MHLGAYQSELMHIHMYLCCVVSTCIYACFYKFKKSSRCFCLPWNYGFGQLVLKLPCSGETFNQITSGGCFLLNWFS